MFKYNHAPSYVERAIVSKNKVFSSKYGYIYMNSKKHALQHMWNNTNNTNVSNYKLEKYFIIWMFL